MPDTVWNTARHLLWRTAPYMLLRCVVWLAALAGFLGLYLGAAHLGWVLGLLIDSARPDLWRGGGALTGGVMALGIVAWLRPFRVLLLDAGHGAALVALMDGDTVPRGVRQIGFSTNRVLATFGTARAAQDMEQSVGATVRCITGLVQGVLPRPPRIRALHRVQKTRLTRTARLFEGPILVQALRPGAGNPWAGGRTALVLYAQSARPLMIHALALARSAWIATFLLFLLALASAGAAADHLPMAGRDAPLVLALACAWAARCAIIDPIVQTVLLCAFSALTDGKSPSQDWADQLDRACPLFRTMAQRAPEARTPGAAGGFRTGPKCTGETA